MNNILEVLKILNEKGYEAYLVGGYPRDLYMNKTTIDYDVTTNATPKEIKEIFKSNISSDNYGCVNVYYKNNRFEITTYRKDIKYNDSRKPIEIEYINDLKLDLMRRDFIINTICIDASGNYIDYLNGRLDIDNKIIRVVGNTNKKLQEDPLRILRAIRFATTLDFKLSKELIVGIKKYGHLVKKLSYERKKQELDKIFSSPNILYGLDLIKELKLEKPLEINVYGIKKTTYLVGIWAQINSPNYPFNKSEKDTIKKVNELINKDILDEHNLYTYGLYISSIAAEIKGIDINLINERYNNLVIKNRNEIAITPEEICEVLNEDPGSILKVVISDLENNLLTNKISNDKNIIVKYLQETYL